jgi:hypothetical protein
MTKEEFENDKVVRICYDNLDKFIDVYPQENKIPENVKLTVYCESSNDGGFLINMTSDELGLEALIVKKWIIHSELEKLVGRSLA